MADFPIGQGGFRGHSAPQKPRARTSERYEDWQAAHRPAASTTSDQPSQQTNPQWQDNIAAQSARGSAFSQEGQGYRYVQTRAGQGGSDPYGDAGFAQDDDTPPPVRLGLPQFAAAAISIALLGGFAVWGYKLMVRDISGIPVVSALEGDMRVAPKDPGGEVVDHQGLSVNNVAAEGEAAPPPDRLVLAPRTVGLSDEDVAQADLPALPAPQQAGTTESALAADSLAAGSLGTDSRAPMGAQSDALGEDTTLLGALEADPVDGAALPLAPPPAPGSAEAIAAVTGQQPGAQTDLEADGALSLSSAEPGYVARGVTASPVPRARPENRVIDVATAQANSPAVLSADPSSVAADIFAALGGVEEVAVADVPAGTRMVQLGAYDSEATARAEWDRIATRFSDVMAGKDRVIEQASSGGSTFYRLRAMGFADLSESRHFCASLVAENAACVPVAQR
ncbi:Sporulation related domain protein [Aquimixticola soesokkakensis]|uniref:Sporulation related domain protein n=1 Tax=Aquimixticola soesokkakensis TaxID=1519096 RepID=A0A1Y5TPK5_9RHOB|nr:SPOR domain-containing protein [Aquimixticola soesokkakensis]SLN65295.1 Sporulation related domain protein [Aquimixticola soesokkakensis]